MQKSWEITNNIYLFIIAGTGIFAVCLYQLELISQTIILSVIVTILSLLTLLVPSQIFEQKETRSTLKRIANEGVTNIVNTVKGVDAILTENRPSLYGYLADRIGKAQEGKLKTWDILQFGAYSRREDDFGGKENIEQEKTRYHREMEKAVKSKGVAVSRTTALWTPENLEYLIEGIKGYNGSNYYVSCFLMQVK